MHPVEHVDKHYGPQLPPIDAIQSLEILPPEHPNELHIRLEQRGWGVGVSPELHIDSLAFGGRGVARLDDFVLFVDRALPGDRVRARVTKVKRRYGEAVAEMSAYLKDGRMKSREDVVRGGVAAFPGTLLKLFSGENFGKLVLHVADA